MNKSEDFQDINIDGEDLVFKKFVKYECLHQEIEFIVDFKYVFEKQFDL